MRTALHELPIEQRIQLVEDLWDSIAADQSAMPLTEWQRAELDRRLDAYEADGEMGQLAEVVLTNVRKML